MIFIILMDNRLLSQKIVILLVPKLQRKCYRYTKISLWKINGYLMIFNIWTKDKKVIQDHWYIISFYSILLIINIIIMGSIIINKEIFNNLKWCLFHNKWWNQLKTMYRQELTLDFKWTQYQKIEKSDNICHLLL